MAFNSYFALYIEKYALRTFEPHLGDNIQFENSGCGTVLRILF